MKVLTIFIVVFFTHFYVLCISLNSFLFLPERMLYAIIQIIISCFKICNM